MEALAIELAQTFEVGAEILNEGIGKVVHAASPEETRPILHSVVFDGTTDGLRVVAADNFRIAVATVSENDASSVGRMVVSLDDIPVLRAFLKVVGKAVTVAPADKRGLTFSGEYGRALTVLTIDGVYPAYETVIPTDGAELVAAINPKFLSDTAKALPKGTVLKIKTTGPLKPVLLEAPTADYIETIMPVRVVE